MTPAKRSRSSSTSSPSNEEKKQKRAPCFAETTGASRITTTQENTISRETIRRLEDTMFMNFTKSLPFKQPTDFPQHIYTDTKIFIRPDTIDSTVWDEGEDMNSDSGYDTDSDIASISKLSFRPSAVPLCDIHSVGLSGVDDEGNDGDDEANSDSDEDTGASSRTPMEISPNPVSLSVSTLSQSAKAKPGLHTRISCLRARPLDDVSHGYWLGTPEPRNDLHFRPSAYLPYPERVPYPAFDQSPSSSDESSSSGHHSSQHEDESDDQTSSSELTDSEDCDIFTRLNPWIQAHHAEADMYANRTDMTISDEEFFSEEGPPPSSPPPVALALDYFYGREGEEEYDEVEEFAMRMGNRA